MTNTSNLHDAVKKCVRCGQCRSVCPVFKLLGMESAAPRGKVFLAHRLESSLVTPSRQVRSHLSLCLLCGTCAAECPVGVDVPGIVAAARLQASNPGQQLLAGAAEYILSKRAIAEPVLRLGAKITGLLPKPLANRSKTNAVKPSISKGSFNKNPIKIGYFPGCATRAIFPGIARDTARVLLALGFEIILPPTLSCCGMPLGAMGQKDKARRLNRQNLDYFHSLNVQSIVTECASCCSTLHEQVVSDPVLSYKMQIRDLNDFIVECLGSSGILKAGIPKNELDKDKTPAQRVTYHDPCHHVQHLGLTLPARQLLTQIPGIDYVEMDEASRCCGGAGSFMAYHPKISAAIAHSKMNNIGKTGADIVTTSCPSCLIQLQRNALQSGFGHIQLRHPVQLLAQQLGH